MKRAQNKRKTTTLSCDQGTREYVAAEAKLTNRLQREILADMVEVYRRGQKLAAQAKEETAKELRTANEIYAAIEKKLDQAIKRDDIVVTFLKAHESMLSTPTLDKVKNCENLLNQLVSILQNLK